MQTLDGTHRRKPGSARSLLTVGVLLVAIGCAAVLLGWRGERSTDAGAASESRGPGRSTGASPPRGAPGTPTSGTGAGSGDTGGYRVAGGGSEPVGQGKLVRYRVEVQAGIGEDPATFARHVDDTLADPRGWTASGRWTFQRVSRGRADVVIRLATPDTVDELCARYGLDTGGEASCRGGPNVMINLVRWRTAIPAYRGDVALYRHLVINHEVGHFLGFRHATCPGPGRPAPVMQTQMYGMHGCVPNGWPFP